MLYFIVNPVAGRGRTNEIQKTLEAHLGRLNLPYKFTLCAHPGHATQLAKEAQALGATAVYSIGGDGSAHEVAQGMLGSTIPMGIIPGGTGNDLAKYLALPNDPITAFDCQRMDAWRPCDAWMINDKLLLNVAGAGFDSETLFNAARFKSLGGGKLSYLVGVFTTILTHKNLQIRLTLNGDTRTLPLLMISIANGRYFGGGIYAAPKALLDDGLLDVILCHPIPRWIMPYKLTKFFSGKQLKEDFVEMIRTDALHFDCDKEIAVQVDGEIHFWSSITVTKVPEPLRILAHKDDPAAILPEEEMMRAAL